MARCVPPHSVSFTPSTPYVSNGFTLQYTLTAHAKTFLTLSCCGSILNYIPSLALHLLCLSFLLDLSFSASYSLSPSFSNDTQSHTFSNFANATKKQPLASTTIRKHTSPINFAIENSILHAMHSECVWIFPSCRNPPSRFRICTRTFFGTLAWNHFTLNRYYKL